MNARTLREVWDVLVLPPVGLEKDAVDLLEVNDTDAVTDGFEKTGDAEVSRAPKDAFARTYDEVERFGGEDAVGDHQSGSSVLTEVSVKMGSAA